MSVGPPLLDGLLKSELGSEATFSRVTADDDSVVGLAISTAELLSGSPRRVIWVENGPATMFSLPQPEPGNAVVSERAIDYASRIRDVIFNDGPTGELRRLAEQTFFSIAAEEALHQGHTDLALKALSMAVANRPPDDKKGTNSGVRPHSDIGELAIWCYGLLHELGHLAQGWTYGHLTEDDAILAKLDWVFDEWLNEPKVVPDVRERALSHPDSVIGIEILRSEVHADLFATEALIRAAEPLLDDARHWEELILEQFAAQQAVVVFHRLKRAIYLSAATAPSPDEAIETILQPVAIAVRNLSQQECIVMARLMGAIAAGRTTTRADVDKERRFVHECIRPFEPAYKILDEALNTTEDFILNKQRHADPRALLEQTAAAANQSRQAADHIEQFLTLAESLRRSTTGIAALREMTTSLAPHHDRQ